MGHDQGFLPDLHIVCYLDKVVDFCALSDDCVAECRTVDGHIGANLHIIFYDYPSDLRYLVMLTLFEGVSVSVGAYYSSGMNNDPVSDCDTFADNYIGMDDAVFPDFGFFPYKNSRQDDCAVPYGNVVRQVCKGVNRDVFAKLRHGWKLPPAR